MGSLALRIAGARLRLDPADGSLMFAVSPPVSAFRCRPGPGADIQADVERKDLSARRFGKLVFESGALWRLHADGDGYQFRFASPVLGEVPYKVARFDAGFNRGEIEVHSKYPGYFPPGTPMDPLEYPLGELLFLHWLALGRGIEVHACGLIDGADGYLFFGHSGAGKTTTAGLWKRRKGVEILSDDRIVIRKEEGDFWMHGTPWHGTGRMASPRRARLKRAYFLRHAPKNKIVSVRHAHAAMLLLSCGFVPQHSRAGLAFTVDFLRDLTAHVPCAELHFAPTAEVVPFVRRSSKQT